MRGIRAWRGTIIKEYADNDISFLRVIRRIAISNNSQKVISIYSNEDYGKGHLYLEKIKWNGTTEIIKKYGSSPNRVGGFRG